MVEPVLAARVSDAVLPPTLRPNLLGIGAAKAGTTSFADLLSRHPDIFLPEQKELNCLHYSDLDDRLGEYAAYFRGGEASPIRCDFSVRYLSSPMAPQAAARLVPDAKIIAVLRNPVDQVQSHYWHLRRQNFHQPTAITEAPDLFEALERFPMLLREPALYAKHIARWLDLFPRSSFFLIEYGEMRRDLPGTLTRLWKFLDIPDPAWPAAGFESVAEHRSGVAPRGGVLGWIYPRVYAAVSRGPFQLLKQTLGVRTAENIKRALRLRESAEAVFFKPGYDKLDGAGRQRLYEIFQSDIEALGKLDLVDVRGWSAS